MTQQTESTPQRPRHVYFTKEKPPLFDSEEFKSTEPTLARAIVYCTSWEQLSEYLKMDPRSICVDVRQIEHYSLIEVISMIETLSKLMGCTAGMTITLSIHHDTPHSLIKDAQKSKVLGIVPSSSAFPPEDTLKGIAAQWNNIPYWPGHIINQLPGAKKAKSHQSDMTLTPRQQQIFDIVVARGCSNKHIAKLMGLSESTVKLHLSNIYKKYSVRNRTQLAVSARNSPII